MSWRPSPTVLPFLAVVFAVACSPREKAPDSETQATQQAAAGPDTTAAAVWAHMQDANYQQAWATWPKKGKLYKGTEPHGALLTTYLNPLALDALTNKASKMPVGAIIVKENYMPDSILAATTIMYKASAGYNPEHNDWFWVKRLTDGTVEVEGRGQMCQSCHGARKANDYIYTGSLK